MMNDEYEGEASGFNSSFRIHHSSFHSSVAHDHLRGALVLARLVAARRLAPGGDGVATARSLTFAAAVRVVHGVHRHAADVRAYPVPARAPVLAVGDVLVLEVAGLPHGRVAYD